MAITGMVLGVSPTKWKIGAFVTVSVNYKVTVGTWEAWRCEARISDGVSEYHTIERAGTTGPTQVEPEFTDSISLGFPMPDTPVILEISLWGATSVGLPGTKTLIAGPYARTIEPTEEDTTIPFDLETWLGKYGMYVAGGALVLGLGYWAVKRQ